MRSKIIRSLLVMAVALSVVAPAMADEHRWRGGHDRGEGWHDRDIHRFRDHDFDRWRGGHWFHGRHEGRFGWWWRVDGGWYFYPAAVYPYPDPYVPPYVAPAASAWYFCPPAQAYYPYVPSCPVPWQVVPAR